MMASNDYGCCGGDAGNWAMMPLSVFALLVKLTAGGAGLAVLEMVSAKMRIFRVPEFLGVAFMLAVLGMLIHFLLEV